MRGWSEIESRQWAIIIIIIIIIIINSSTSFTIYQKTLYY